MEPLLLGPTDLATLLNCSRRQVEKAAARHAIPGRVKVTGPGRKPMRFNRKAVLAWVDRDCPGLYAR